MLGRAPLHGSRRKIELLHPNAPQGLDRRHLPQPARRCRVECRSQERVAVLADGPGALFSTGGVLRQAIVKGAVPVAFRPVRLGMRPQPVGRRDGQAFQRVTHRLGNALQPVQGAHRGQNMRGIGPLPPTSGQQVPFTGKRQHRVEQHLLRPTLDQMGSELAQHGAVEARVGQRQRQGILPVDPAADRLGRLTVGQPLGELEQGHQGKPPGRLCRAATGGEQVSKPDIVEHRAEFVAQARVATALEKRSAGDAHGLLGDGWGDLKEKGHDADLRARRRDVAVNQNLAPRFQHQTAVENSPAVSLLVIMRPLPHGMGELMLRRCSPGEYGTRCRRRELWLRFGPRRRGRHGRASRGRRPPRLSSCQSVCWGRQRMAGLHWSPGHWRPGQLWPSDVNLIQINRKLTAVRCEPLLRAFSITAETLHCQPELRRVIWHGQMNRLMRHQISEHCLRCHD